MASLRKPWRTVFGKYLVLLVALVTGTLFASSLLETYFSYQENKSALFQIQREKAQAAAAEIEAFIREIESQIGWTTLLPLKPDALDQHRFDLLRLFRQVPAVTEVSRLDAFGREQLRVSRLTMDVVGSQADFSQQPKFTEAMSKKVYFGPVYFRRESEPYMTVAIAGSRRDAGVSVAEINLKFIWEVISRIKVGEAGYAYVVDDRGRLIAHPDISLVLRKTNLASLAQVQAARAPAESPGQGSEEVSIAHDVDGRSVLAAHAAIVPLDWMVFVELPLNEAFAPLYSSLTRTVVLMLVGLAVAILASALLARRMVTPIQALKAGAAAVGAGDFDRRIEIRTGDELEGLADQFNRMAKELQESQAKAERLARLKRFLSPQIAEVIESSGHDRVLTSHRQEITVVFCDLRGFTTFAETAEPEEVMGLLKEYHETLGRLIFRFEGTLERFLGDGLMVLFNDPLPCPDPSVRAVRMAAEMRQNVRSLTRQWRNLGHELDFGIGIADGFATLGRIGFEGRFDYAAIGSVPNLASRLCDHAKGGQILISQSVYAAVQDVAEVEPVGELSLKGFHRPVAAYNVRRVPA